MKRLTDIPTAELLQRAERNAFEKGIAGAGFPLSLTLILVSWFLIFRYLVPSTIPGLLLCLLASILIPLIICWLTKFLSEWRDHSLINELNRRFGLWSIPQYIKYYRDQLQPGEIQCIFRAQALPGGCRYWARLTLDHEGNLLLKQSRSPRSISAFSTPAWSEVTTTEVTLTSEQKTSIQTLIHEATAQGNQKIQMENRIKDGFPAALAIILGDGSEPITIYYYLSLLEASSSENPRLELLKIFAFLTGDFGCTRRLGSEFNANSANSP
ncbi:hypothetical protein Enr10x_48330 [Gimesia panareensis]|uniref:DUF3137 domain-containing protein n=1 Tax=Gimesia panareensis TaxID=2527978 RepID=A0A517QCW3_9PLAN|nr:hypothetical protein [Gimesia panareensis]QDT29478.1 hypothetical protein Enr10x_48330 [Gimesia panareensis]